MRKALILGAAFIIFSIFLPLGRPASAADILINEFIPNPATGDSEWVEFYNTTNSTVDLSDYFFDDDTNFDSDSGSSAKVALSGILQATQTCFWELSSYLNNNGDSPTLFTLGNSSPVDTYTYSSSSAGLSYARIPNGGSWNFNQTPSKPSNRCIDSTPTSTPTNIPTPTSEPTSTKTPTPTKILTPTKTTTPTKSPTPTPTSKAAKVTASPSKTITKSNNQGALGIFTKQNQSENNPPDSKLASLVANNWIGVLSILLAIVFTILCAIVIFRPKIEAFLRRNGEDSN